MISGDHVLIGILTFGQRINTFNFNCPEVLIIKVKELSLLKLVIVCTDITYFS